MSKIKHMGLTQFNSKRNRDTCPACWSRCILIPLLPCNITQGQTACENDPSSQHDISSQGESDCFSYPLGVNKRNIHSNVYRI